ncbi:hypothetical protein HDU98_011119 [Podochytrium sp. JEL0797]|nr:hypothetical protein HDU98_011119 [Podochytrium sp. JEL0797]
MDASRVLARITLLAVSAMFVYYVSTSLYSLVAPAPFKTCIHVEGLPQCPYHLRSVALAEKLHAEDSDVFGAPGVKAWSRNEWPARKQVLYKNIPEAEQRRHATSPFVWIRECRDGDLATNPDNAFKRITRFVGGNDDFQKWNMRDV